MISILIVDDRPSVINDVKAQLSSVKGIHLWTATTLPGARKIIKAQFLHASFIDLYITSKGKRGGTAVDVMRDLIQFRPTCKRVVFTQQMSQGWRDLLPLLHPTAEIFPDAIWNRADGQRLGDIIQRFIKHHRLESSITITNLRTVYDAVERKTSSPLIRPQSGTPQFSGAISTAEEIEFIVSSMFGGFQPPALSPQVASITLKELGRGKSSAAVFRGRPVNVSGDRGILSIVKIGVRANVEQEISAFNRYVRLFRNTYRRVEVLGSCLSDTLGGVCYSFAGQSPSEVDDLTSLQDVLEQDDVERAISILRSEMNPSQKEWYSREYRMPYKDRRNAAARLLPTATSFFERAYGVRYDKDIYRISQYAHEFMTDRKGVGGIYVEDTRSWYIESNADKYTVNLPRDSDIALINLIMPKPRMCVVHGDMNGDNLLSGGSYKNESLLVQQLEAERVILIDYAQTQPAPVFVDFAALEATCRLTNNVLKNFRSAVDYKKLVDIAQMERKVIEGGWDTPTNYETSRLGLSILEEYFPPWARVSHEIVQLARGNFQGASADGVKVKMEYVATCILYAIRLLKIERLSAPYETAARARLLVWLSELLLVLRSSQLAS